MAVLLLAGCTQPPAPAVLNGRIDGAVVDAFLNPYPFQNVTLPALHLVDQTSRLGGFTFRDVPPGSYTLVSHFPGADGDVKVVEVRPGQITRVILQLIKRNDPLPFVTNLKDHGRQDLAQPGTECTGCAWQTYLLQTPAEVVVRATWAAAPIGDDQLTLELHDATGKVLASKSGPTPIELSVPGEQLGNTDKLGVTVRFGAGFTPRPFDMDSYLDLYYVAPRAQQEKR